MECLGEFSGVGVQTPMQDYKCLHSAVMIWAILVNTRTHIDMQTAFEQLYMIS